MVDRQAAQYGRQSDILLVFIHFSVDIVIYIEAVLLNRSYGMPDGDRFEWKLRGKGTRKLYRLMCGGADLQTLTSHSLKAIAAYLRQNASTQFGAFIAVVEQHLSARTLPLIPPESPISSASRLASALGEVVAAEQYSEVAQLCDRASQKTFFALEGQDASVSVGDQFASDFAWEAVERLCLGPVRDEIMRRQGRSLGEQMQFEQELRSEVEKEARRFSKQLSDGVEGSRFRAPGMAVKKVDPATLLSQPLSILSEAK